MRPSYMPYPIPDRGRGSHLERERDMGLQDLHDTTLVLGLGFKPKRDDQPPATNKTSSFHSSGSVGPALTLGRQSSSSHSTVSSHSDVVKRERSMDGSDGKEEVDEEDGRNKKKLRLTKEQSVLLEDRFKEHSSLNPKQKAALAKQLNLQPRQVEVWFQNRRARTKLKQTEVDCEFLRRCCEMLTEENRRLQNEVKDLKSNTTLPPPFYVQPIPTTAVAVGVCPYCQRITGPHDHNNTNSTKVDGKSFTTQPTSS